MANALSAYNARNVLHSLSLGMQCCLQLINMANALSSYNTHVLFYIAFHSVCRFIYINKPCYFTQYTQHSCSILQSRSLGMQCYIH